MNNIVKELNEIIIEFSTRIEAISDQEFSVKPLPHKWSKKEILGHLIDSGHNNLRRFICGQYESAPPKITYEQDFWVAVNDYQNTSKEDILQLWKLINKRICAVLTSTPLANYSRECDTGKQAVQLHTIQWLAEDYVKHMKHHLNQIIPASFDIKYS